MKHWAIFVLFWAMLARPDLALGQAYYDSRELSLRAFPSLQSQDQQSTYLLAQSVFRVEHPVFSHNLAAVMLGIDYRAWWLKPMEPSAAPDAYHRLGLLLDYRVKVSDVLRTSFYVRPALSSDFVEHEFEDMVVEFGARMQWKVHRNLHYSFGFLYAQEHFGPFFLPTIGLYWFPNRFMLFNFDLPYSAQAELRLFARMTVSAYIQTEFASIRLSSSEQNSDYIQVGNNQFGGLLDYYINDNWILRASVGHTLTNQFQRFPKGQKVELATLLYSLGDNRQPVTPVLRNGFLFQLSLRYRLYFQH